MNFVQRQKEEERRHILKWLYEAGKALRAKSVRHALSDLGVCSMLWRVFAEHLDYMAREEVIRVFPAGTRNELSEVEQAKFIEQVKSMRYDDAESETVMVRIRQKGIHFIEGNEDGVKGIARE
ncbi:MAG TPA: hypothetical protein VN743_01615 [Blastocatellia bacterium]|nr:hypothetical protein [Blastocatellia bacterium]